ncbi:MAG: hypothetical protein CMN82_13810 [Spongiibacter sp.]|nr:hypothetical protein [Spongiibacter sp.]|tara:strand:- start:26 stop:355 length:330 start_codon:yes stop_codon:yes gene_type:complete
MYRFSLFLVFGALSGLANAASFGWAVPKSVLQEAGILHVEFGTAAPRTGLPGCAVRTFIDVSTDAGRMRASLALTAFAAKKEVWVEVDDEITGCQWGTSVPNKWIRARQ